MPTDPTFDAPRKSVGQQGSAVFALAAPLIGSHLAQLGVVTTDTLMMGWYGVTPLAGLSIAGPLWFIIFIMLSGFAFAVMPMVATALAQEDNRQIRRVTRMGMWLSILAGAIVTPMFLFSEPLLLAMGQEPAVAHEAARYLAVLGFTYVPGLLIMVLKSYLSSLELTRSILVFTVIAVFLNIPINYAFIYGNWGAPEMGVVGAAIASLCVNIFLLVSFAVYAVRARPEHELFKNFHRPDWEAFFQVFRLGAPIGLTQVAEAGLFAASSVMMGWLGAVPLAAHGIALQITSLTFMAHVGLSSAATIKIGAAWGKKRFDDIRNVGLATLGLSMSFVLATIVLFLTVPEFLVGLFVDQADPEALEIIRIGALLLMVSALFQVVDATQMMGLGMLRGVQDTAFPLVLALISYWIVGVPASYALGFTFGFGGVGIWLGLTAGLSVAAVLLQWRFWSRYDRK